LNSDRRHRALNDLLNAHGEHLYATLYRLTLRRDAATELLQELFVRLGGSAGFDRADDPVAYAWRTAINLAMEWRRRRRQTVWSSTDGGDVEAEGMSPLQHMVQTEEFEQLLGALSGLSELTREAFVLRYIEQESFNVVARRLGKTPHQARGLCHAAVRQLREQLTRTERP